MQRMRSCGGQRRKKMSGERIGPVGIVIPGSNGARDLSSVGQSKWESAWIEIEHQVNS